MLRSHPVTLTWISGWLLLAGTLGGCRMGYDVVENGASTGGGGAGAGASFAGNVGVGGQAASGGLGQGPNASSGGAVSTGSVASTGGSVPSTGGGGASAGASGGGASGGQASAGGSVGWAGSAGIGGSDLSACFDVPGCSCVEEGAAVYQFCPGPADLLASGIACTVMGMARVEIEDAAENEFVRQALTDAGLLGPGAEVWLGGTDLVSEGTWAWLDRSVYWDQGAATSLFENWEDPPTDDALDCMVMTSSGLWREADCLQSLPFVCKR